MLLFPPLLLKSIGLLSVPVIDIYQSHILSLLASNFLACLFFVVCEVSTKDLTAACLPRDVIASYRTSARYFSRLNKTDQGNFCILKNTTSILLWKSEIYQQTYKPSVRHLKKILMLNWDLIQNQPLHNTIFRNPPIAYK